MSDLFIKIWVHTYIMLMKKFCTTTNRFLTRSTLQLQRKIQNSQFAIQTKVCDRIFYFIQTFIRRSYQNLDIWPATVLLHDILYKQYQSDVDFEKLHISVTKPQVIPGLLVIFLLYTTITHKKWKLV